MPRQKPKLPTSSVVAGLDFQPNEELWAELGKVYDVVLSEKQKHELAEIIQKFFVWVQFEKAAEDLDDYTRFLDRLDKPARLLHRLIVERGNSEAVNTAEDQINKYLHTYWAGAADPNSPDEFGAAMHGIGEALDADEFAAKKIKEAKESNGFQDIWSGKNLNLIGQAIGALVGSIEMARSDPKDRGSLRDEDAWKCLAKDLTIWANNNGFDTGARKDDMGKISPFVRFFSTLQCNRCFPDQFSRHRHSNQALAKAIAEARKVQRDE